MVRRTGLLYFHISPGDHAPGELHPLARLGETSRIFLLSSDRSLPNHVISTLEVPSRIDCTITCLAELQCMSYNFQVTPTNGHHSCELNRKTRDQVGVELQARPGFDYYESVPEVTRTSYTGVTQ